MSRVLALAAAFALLAAPAAGGRSLPPGAKPTKTQRPTSSGATSWAAREIRVVVARGLMAKSVATFRPNDPLTQGELSALVAGLTDQPLQRAANPAAPVAMAQLDARLVRALGVSAAATSFRAGAADAGLTVPTRFGTEVAARLLGLRTNHPAKLDDLELRPTDPATRAEAAYSAAQILRFRGWEVNSLTSAADSFVLPQPSPWQKRVLNVATRFIGFPYVWGGTSEGPGTTLGTPTRGGFDCSGFAWRVYKLQAYPGGAALAQTLRGRTTYAMSGEVPRSKRVPFAKLRPGDLLFFGARGPRSKPAEVDHMGLYLGNRWLIHSSSYGVAVAQLRGWYRERFAWGRRPLAEAGLTS
ncbi:MAG: NlpC/P60 family protein [Actinomycetota bacterium]|nr:NlpC/P60 family protein [Actinomycetota bacterium]